MCAFVEFAIQNANYQQSKMQEAGFGAEMNNQLAVCNNAIWALGELAQTHTDN